MPLTISCLKQRAAPMRLRTCKRSIVNAIGSRQSLMQAAGLSRARCASASTGSLSMLSLLLLIAGLVLLVLAALNLVASARVNLLAAGLALWAASVLAARLGA